MFREMRRKKQQLTTEECVEILKQEPRGILSMLGDDGYPYGIPMTHWYCEENGHLYFHGAKEGRKIDLIKKTTSVGFELDTNYRLEKGNIACEYTAGFQSIIGTGEICLIEEKEEKKAALQAIMEHYTQKKDWKFSEQSLSSVAVFKLEVKELSCKEHL